MGLGDICIDNTDLTTTWITHSTGRNVRLRRYPLAFFTPRISRNPCRSQFRNGVFAFCWRIGRTSPSTIFEIKKIIGIKYTINQCSSKSCL